MARKYKKHIAAGGAIAMFAAVVVGNFEGLRTKAYLDVIGVPTVCYGETKGVKLGDRYTPAQCHAMLRKRLVQFSGEMNRCLKAPDKIPDRSYVAFLSFSYNVGAKAFCKSTLVRKLNAGDLRGACDQLPRWNRAGGRVIKGLTNRRIEERKLCFDGLRGKKL